MLFVYFCLGMLDLVFLLCIAFIHMHSICLPVHLYCLKWLSTTRKFARLISTVCPPFLVLLFSAHYTVFLFHPLNGRHSKTQRCALIRSLAGDALLISFLCLRLCQFQLLLREYFLLFLVDVFAKALIDCLCYWSASTRCASVFLQITQPLRHIEQ